MSSGEQHSCEAAILRSESPSEPTPRPVPQPLLGHNLLFPGSLHRMGSGLPGGLVCQEPTLSLPKTNPVTSPERSGQPLPGELLHCHVQKTVPLRLTHAALGLMVSNRFKRGWRNNRPGSFKKPGGEMQVCAWGTQDLGTADLGSPITFTSHKWEDRRAAGWALMRKNCLGRRKEALLG